MSSKRTLEERIQEKDERMQKAKEKARQYEAQKRKLERMQKEADRRKRTRRLIEIGGAVESVLGREFKEGNVIRLLNFLKGQEARGRFFTNAMQAPIPAEPPANDAEASVPDSEAGSPQEDDAGSGYERKWE